MAIVPSHAFSGQIIPCTPVNVVIEKLRIQYREKVLARGIEASGSLVLLLGKDDLSTWTIIIVNNRGFVCNIMSGSDWGSISDLGTMM